jgi:hypothetical protein
MTVTFEGFSPTHDFFDYTGSAMPCWHASLKPSIKSVSFPPAAKYKVPKQLLHSRFDGGLAINATLGHYQGVFYLDTDCSTD